MLLLDSHVAIWALDEAPQLGVDARRAITGPSDVYVSAASIWELTIKSMLGKIDIPAELPALLAEAGFQSLSVTAEHAEGIREFPELAKHDPSIVCWSPRRVGRGCGCSPPIGCCWP